MIFQREHSLAKKRVYEVVNNNPNKKALKVGKETYRYGKNNMFTVKDPDIGREIMKNYDLDAVVNEVELSTNTEAGHKYTFSGVDTSKFKSKKQSRFVWVREGRAQKLVELEYAIENELEIVKKKRLAQGAEVLDRHG